MLAKCSTKLTGTSWPGPGVARIIGSHCDSVWLLNQANGVAQSRKCREPIRGWVLLSVAWAPASGKLPEVRVNQAGSSSHS